MSAVIVAGLELPMSWPLVIQAGPGFSVGYLGPFRNLDRQTARCGLPFSSDNLHLSVFFSCNCYECHAALWILLRRNHCLSPTTFVSCFVCVWSVPHVLDQALGSSKKLIGIVCKLVTTVPLKVVVTSLRAMPFSFSSLYLLKSCEEYFSFSPTLLKIADSFYDNVFVFLKLPG